MKLYTEDLKNKAEAAWEDCHGCNENDKNIWINGYIKGALANKIELPSDEEIEIYLKSFPYTKHLDDGQYNDGVIVGAELAIQWMRDKIQKDNK